MSRAIWTPEYFGVRLLLKAIGYPGPSTPPPTNGGSPMASKEPSPANEASVFQLRVAA